MTPQRYSAMLDWGLRLSSCWRCRRSVALLVFAQPLVATLFHYGAFKDSDVSQVALALAGYGAGLVGLVAIKVLAPGFYASQDMRTPVRIAVVVLAITQLLNIALVPLLQARRAGAVYRPGGADQRRLAAGGPAQARQLPAGAGLGQVRAPGVRRQRAACAVPDVGRPQLSLDCDALACAGSASER